MLIANFHHGRDYAGAPPHDSNRRSARTCVQIKHCNGVEGRRLPMCPLSGLEPQLHPPTRLDSV